MLVVVFEMVRRRRLMERYALMWLLSALVLTVVSAWPAGLRLISHALGIAYPPSALFFIALGFILLLLLHFSSAVSRLSDQTKLLAQRAALLEERLRRLEGQEEERQARGTEPGFGRADPGLAYERRLAAAANRERFTSDS